MNYQILNYLGEELIASISQEELITLKTDTGLNFFEWDESESTHIITGFAKKKEENPSEDLDNVRIVKEIL